MVASNMLLQVMWWSLGWRLWLPTKKYLLPNWVRLRKLSCKRLEHDSDGRLDIHVNSSYIKRTLSTTVLTTLCVRVKENKHITQ